VSGTHGYSYGAAIYAYNESVVTGTGFSFSRQKISTYFGFKYGGPTEIGCYGESSVFLDGVTVDSMLLYGVSPVTLESVAVHSMFTYDEANVTVYGGTVAGSLGLYNSSVASLYGVTFPSTVVTDDAHLILAHCTESTGAVLTSAGHSKVDITNKTTMVSTFGVSLLGATFTPGINATGNSEVYFLSSSTTSTLLYGGAVASVYDNATFVDQNGVIDTGTILAFDNSSVLFNKTEGLGMLENVEIIGNNSSSVSIYSCSLTGAPNPITIDLFDSSHVRIVNSTISAGYFVFSDNSTAYVSSTTMTSSSRIIAQGNVNLTVVDGSNIEDSIEMRENARLGLESSTASLIYCPDSSQASLVNGSATELSVSGNSTVHLVNSTVQELSSTESNVTGSLSGLTHFLENSTITFLGSGSQVSVVNTTVNGLDFSFSGNSNVVISNSTLRNLSLQGSSVATLVNASVYAGLYAVGNSTVFLYSALRVRCVDSFGNPLNGSVVTVSTNPSQPGGVETGTTDRSGWASFVFFSGLVNATGSFPLTFVAVSGSFGGASTSESVGAALFGKDVTLSLPLPWWSGYILPVVILVVIVALLALIGYAYTRVHARR
jgi:hypothetical protein